MAEDEKKVTENADAEKNKKGFAYNDVEAAVNKMMTPTVKKVLEDRYHVDMAAMLPVIHQNSTAIEGDTIEAYAQRCIEAALASQVQQTAVEKIEEKRGKKEVAKVELDEETAPKKDETPEPTKEGGDIYKEADEIQKRIVLAMLGLPFKMIKAIVEDKKIATVFNKDNTASVVQLSKDETEFVCTSMQKAKDMLSKAYEIDGLEVQSEQEQEDAVKKSPIKPRETIEPKQEGEKEEPADTDTIKLKNGKDLTYADFKAALKKLSENPKSKALIEKLGVDVDEVAAEMFNKIDPSVHEDALSCAQASLGYVMARKEMLEAYGLRDIGFAKLKDDAKDKKGIDENKENEPRNDLFANMKDILKFPFEVFKRIATGKTDEELKKEAERLNLKDVHLELTTQTREVLTKRLEGYESTLAQAVYDLRRQEEIAAQAPGASKQPLSEVGKKATRKIVDDTHEMGYGEPDGKKTIQTIEYDQMTPEEKAKHDAEKAAAKEQKNRDGNEGLDENDPLSKYSQGR